MAVQVRIPTPLQKLTQNQGSVAAEGETVRQIFEDLENRFPGIKERLCDDSGSLRHFINVYLNDEDIRYLEGEDTPLRDGDELSIIPAIAGGAEGRLGRFSFPPVNQWRRAGGIGDSRR